MSKIGHTLAPAVGSRLEGRGIVRVGLAVAVASLLFGTTLACAQEPIIFPNNGQSAEQLATDKDACYSWAKGQSGFDPMAPPVTSTPPPQQTQAQGGVVKGAARGALIGTAVGAISGDTGKGAAIGAASGGLMGGMRRRDQRRQQSNAEQQWAQQESAKYEQLRGTYNRAYSACLEGKGYTVK